MHITKQKLKNIIKEELDILFKEEKLRQTKAEIDMILNYKKKYPDAHANLMWQLAAMASSPRVTSIPDVGMPEPPTQPELNPGSPEPQQPGQLGHARMPAGMQAYTAREEEYGEQGEEE